MTKIRPTIVISPRLPHRGQIATIVPISTTPPRHLLPFVVKLSRNYHPDPGQTMETWAKCDMIMNVGLHRLNGFKVGRRKWAIPEVTPEDLKAVRLGVIYGLGLGHLIKDLSSAT